MPVTKENAHLFLPLVQAIADGKTIEVDEARNGKWKTLDAVYGISFGYKPEQYRIKKEPLYIMLWWEKEFPEVKRPAPTTDTRAGMEEYAKKYFGNNIYKYEYRFLEIPEIDQQ